MWKCAWFCAYTSESAEEISAFRPGMMLLYSSWTLAYLYQSILLSAQFESIIFWGSSLSLPDRNIIGLTDTIWSMNFSLTL